jgi:Bacterial Ig-like domain (group 3)/FG-GAP-like repeat/FG-GAP repeat
VTRQAIALARILKRAAQFICAITILIAVAALAQQRDLSQSTQKPAATFIARTPPTKTGNTHVVPASRSPRRARAPQNEAQNALFLPGVTYGPVDEPNAVAIADVNGDGRPDVLTAGYYFDVFLGNGDGTLQPPITDTDVNGLQSLAVADLNGDGKLDVVLIAPYNNVSVLLGNGDGTFQPPFGYVVAQGKQLTGVAVADVNGDGKPDIVISGSAPGDQEDGAVAVLLGNGDGTFQPAVYYDSGGVGTDSVVIADMNGDGKPDLLVASPCILSDCDPASPPLNFVSILLGNGDGTFQPAVTYSSGGGIVCGEPNSGPLSVADLNGDGKLDVVVVNVGCGSIAVMLGNGDGTLQSATSYDPGGGPCCLAIADANGDAKPDILVVNSNWNGQTYVSAVGILQGNGDGTFQAPVNVPTNGISSGGIAAADLNGDGKPDLAVSNYEGAGTVSVVLNNTGGAPPLTTLSSSPNPSVVGQSVTLTTSVTSPKATPTGTVNFSDGATLLGNSSLNNGIASFNVSSLNAGTHSLTAAYLGSGSFYPSTSNPLSESVNKTSTSTVVTSSADPVQLNKPVTLYATVTTQYGSLASGTVTFTAGSETLGTASVYGWGALQVSFPTDGTYSIVATYSGDANGVGSISPPFAQYVDSVESKTTVTTSPSLSFVAQPVTITAAVKSTSKLYKVPDGETVTFYKENTQLGTATTANGAATFITSALPYGNLLIKAVYSGDAVLLSSSGTAKQVVERYSTTTTSTSSPNPSNYKQPVTFTATVISAGPDPPTGTVAFADGTTIIGKSKLSSGVTSLTKSNLGVGTHSITAVYEGDSESSKSTSPILTQVVN